MHIFIVSGKAQSGKDEFCKVATPYLSSRHFKCAQLAFADEVKRVAREFGWGGVKNEKGRSLLQWVGDGGRQFDPDIWIKKLLFKLCEKYCNSLYYLEADNDVLFITDARYPNEIDRVREWAQENDGVSVHAVRVTRTLDFDNGLTPEQKMNTSETALDDYVNYDYMIANIGTLEDYHKKIMQILDEIIKRG